MVSIARINLRSRKHAQVLRDKSYLCPSSLSHHFANHHDVGPQVLADREEVQDAHKPEDDADAVEDAAVAQGGWSQTQRQPNQEEHNGHGITDVPHLTEVDPELLAELFGL